MWHARILRKQGAYDVFDGNVYLSCEIGYTKDQHEAYRYVLEDLHVEPEDTVLVDDNSSNIGVARGVGIKGIRFKGLDHLKRKIESMSD
jgi:HAD superfamily hydrolase (TIGR01509 family)